MHPSPGSHAQRAQIKVGAKATDYEILRGIGASSQTPCEIQPSKRPLRVGVLLDEAAFIAGGGLIKHLDTVFLDDWYHDWRVDDSGQYSGQFFYYGHGLGLGCKADVIVIYAISNEQ